jgi:hypothetical protein
MLNKRLKLRDSRVIRFVKLLMSRELKLFFKDPFKLIRTARLKIGINNSVSSIFVICFKSSYNKFKLSQHGKLELLGFPLTRPSPIS